MELNRYEQKILLNLLEHEMDYISDELENSIEYRESLDNEWVKLYNLKKKIENEIKL